jgi:hypothetical protein
VDADLFARVGELLRGGQRNWQRTGNRHGFLLRGLVRCTACGSAMTSVVSAPRGKPYRYYSCTQPRRQGTSVCPVRNVSAAELERFVVERIKGIGQDPVLLKANRNSLVSQLSLPKSVRFQCLPDPSADTGECRAGSRSLLKSVQNSRPRARRRANHLNQAANNRAPLRCRGEACVKQTGALFALPGRVAPHSPRCANTYSLFWPQIQLVLSAQVVEMDLIFYGRPSAARKRAPKCELHRSPIPRDLVCGHDLSAETGIRLETFRRKLGRLARESQRR